jgi:hypothetical protein
MAEYTYNLIDTNDSKLLEHKLESEINADPGIAPTCTLVERISGSQFKVHTNIALSGAEEVTLTGVVNSHKGANIPVHFRGSVELITTEENVISDASFVVVGHSIATNPEALMESGDINKLLGRIVIMIKTNGATCELRVKEIDANDGNVAYLKTEVLPDTSDLYQIHKFFTDTLPRSGDWVYCFEARLNGSTSLYLKAGSLSVLESE